MGSLSDLDSYTQALGASVRANTHVVAWSFGGLLAMRLATDFPAVVKKILFIASTAKFINQNSAIDPRWFNQFQFEFEKQPQVVLKKFLSLQTKGDEFAQSTLRQLREVSPVTTYDFHECKLGLSLLGKLDLTEELKQLSCATAFVHGECDAVLPVEAGRAAAALCGAKFFSIPEAGHAPHVSHPQHVSKIISNFFPSEYDDN